MKTVLRTLLLIMMMISPVMIVFAQNDELPSYASGCDPIIRDELAMITPDLDFDTGCIIYEACVTSGTIDVECHTLIYKTFLRPCMQDDVDCRDGALLTASAIMAFGRFLGESTPRRIAEGIPEALAAFWEGNDQRAFEIIQPLPERTVEPDYNNLTPAMLEYDNPRLHLMIGILAARADEPEIALEAYATTFQLGINQPLTWVARAHLYGELGRDLEASFDAHNFVLWATTIPVFADLAQELAQTYPFDETLLEAWRVYPVSSFSSINIGFFESDLTGVTGGRRPIVRMTYIEEIDVIVTIGLPLQLGNSFVDDTGDHLLIFTRMSEASYGMSYSDLSLGTYGIGGTGSPTSISLSRVGDFYVGEIFVSTASEASWGVRFYLSPPGVGEPPLEESLSERICPDGVRTRLEVGNQASSTVGFQSLPGPDGSEYSIQGLLLYSSPRSSIVAIVSGLEEFTIIGGPECREEQIFWEVELDNGTMGWLAENTGITYIVAPIPSE